jgi:hypothetical protein
MSIESPSLVESDHEETCEFKTMTTTLYEELQRLRTTSHLLSHRLHTLQTLLDEDRFELSEYPIRVKAGPLQSHVNTLLNALSLSEHELTLGTFLTALNQYLIHQELVDLNDLQIHMTPLLHAAFHKPLGLAKLPYPLLLLALPTMFE